MGRKFKLYKRGGLVYVGGMDEEDDNNAVLYERKALPAINPAVWLTFLAVPLVLGLVISLNKGAPDAPIENPRLIAAEEAKTKVKSESYGQRGGGVAIDNPAITPKPAAEKKTAYKCDFAPWVGLKVSEDMLGALKGAERPYRVLEPGSAMTMDHAPARVNFDLNEAGAITRIWCG